MSTNRLPNWYLHVERPDTSYPDYDKYDRDPDEMFYGYDDFDDEYRVYSDQKLADTIDEYCGAKADAVVDKYWKMGEPDAETMEAYKEKWGRQ